ncbi:T9SS type A sorting domain-containing protein [Polaribacter vadi]|uniref:T9SS type A sorting domain-containing protein n=1 Tax=Polaribacter TaxID=52959 RepID=UPI001C085808|nr:MULTISPECIES: T9SS type A sorting domain-containing protein [Polaribacter]MBU3010461.1 T9SS type A sorting domain-containing protein [Polaribacter vadi]MDO6740269.1 T9SS type A sorting domain-containing protein [Polaribacter sp. 1_MG-2023]
MRKKVLGLLALVLVAFVGIVLLSDKNEANNEVASLKKIKKKKKTIEEKMLYAKERELYELGFQINPTTGKIPLEEKEQEYNTAYKLLNTKSKSSVASRSFISRGPSNLGGRTRALRIDVSDPTGNTIIAGGVSSGVFRTTDGGANWTKVSNNDEIHNVTAIAQDTRVDSQNIWYYATGEWSGNSASLGSAYRGQGVWKSIDSGLNWSQIALTNSVHEAFDSYFDYVNALEVSPINGELFIAATGKIYRYDGTTMNVELEMADDATGWTDVKIASNGRVFAAIEGTSKTAGVTTSPTGNGSWTLLARNGNPTGWSAAGRITLAVAPSNNDVFYALYNNGKTSDASSDTYEIEADLWKYDLSTSTWTNYSDKLPDESGGNSEGNDPFAIQGGYDLVVSVKPDNENFVVVGGTNPYKIENITTDVMFSRIGGYVNNLSYGTYSVGGTNHHPDIHQLVFDPQDPTTLYSGTDGGIHKALVTVPSVAWTSLNNNYQTYQYYHVAMDPQSGKDIVLGGAQDNGTTVGGLDYASSAITDKSTMVSMAGGDGVAVGIGRNSNALRYYLGFQNGTIYQRKNGFLEITPDDSSSQFVTYFYLDPDNNETLYYAGQSSLFVTNDAENITSETWTNLGTLPGTNEFIRTIATTRGTYNAATSHIYIGGQSGGIFRVSDPQNVTSISTSAVNITPASASKASGSIVSDIAIHPTNPDIVLAVYSNYGINNIYLTTNATAASPTWDLVERNLDVHSIRSAAITQVGSEITYFVGTAKGLYSSTDPTSIDWAIEGANDLGLAIISSLVYRPSDNKLLIGTHGNGMYETTIEETLSVSSFNDDLKLSIYPNPVATNVFLKSSLIDSNDDVTYEIYNLIGKSVKKGQLKDAQINVENLTVGAYILNIKSKDLKQSVKFIKE